MPNKKYMVANFHQGEGLTRFFPNMAYGAELYSDRQAMLGICYALSLNWLRRVAYFRNEGPYDRIARVGSEKSIVNATQAQMFSAMGERARDAISESGELWITKNVHDRLLRLDSNNFIKTIKIFDFSRLNLALQSSISSNLFRFLLGSINLEECARALTNRITAPLTHHIIFLDLATNDGHRADHAVACSMSSGVLLFFDSNSGEAHVPEADVQKFLFAMLSRLGTKYKFSAFEALRVS